MADDGLRDFYVTFGGHLFDYYLHIRARDEDIVRIYMRDHSKLGAWCGVYDHVPPECKPLQEKPTDLWYASAKHI